MELLRERNKYSPVTIQWVKGHAGNTGNEYADMLARIGQEESERLTFAAPFIPISRSSLNREIHTGQIRLWQLNWENRRDCRVSRLFFPEVKVSRSVIKLTARELQELAKIGTGHGLFKDHLRHWTEMEEEDYLCSLCGEDYENSWHLWDNCPILTQERKLALQYMKGGTSYERALLKFFREDKVLDIISINEVLVTTT